MKQIDLVVVDVGNSACKVGAVHAEQLHQVYRFRLDDCEQEPWRHPEVSELLARKPRWVLSGSNPPIILAFAQWLNEHHQSVHVIDATTTLPLEIDVDYPEKVGRDRLLNALAVDAMPAIIISAGSAITVDAVDAHGRFLGGAIFPGIGLMAKSLHDHTAQLPLIMPAPPRPLLPARNTEHAIHAGILHAAVGGIVSCVNEMLPNLARPSSPEGQPHSVSIYMTGGDAPVLQPSLFWTANAVPHLTLHGMIVASRTLLS